jgi:hypothetical protein
MHGRPSGPLPVQATELLERVGAESLTAGGFRVAEGSRGGDRDLPIRVGHTLPEQRQGRSTAAPKPAKGLSTHLRVVRRGGCVERRGAAVGVRGACGETTDSVETCEPEVRSGSVLEGREQASD